MDSGVRNKENGVNGYGRGFCLGKFDLVDKLVDKVDKRRKRLGERGVLIGKE